MLMVRLLPAYYPCVLLALVAAQPGDLAAQPQKYEGTIVRNIQFDPQQQPLDPSEVHEILPLKINQPLRLADVRASIERLFATGVYADIQVDARPYRDGVAIVFVTKPSWFIGAVSTDGRIASPPNPGQLENAAELNLGQPFTDAKLQQGLANQKRLLESNGLYRNRVSPDFDRETQRQYRQVNIRFDIESGSRARFTTPVLTGDLKMDADKILRATRFRRWLIHTWKPMTQTRVRQALDGVRSLYQKENRLEAKVLLESMRYDPETNRALPTLHI
jgi:outer membrane protein insertion porin family